MILSYSEFEHLIATKPAVLVYFSHDQCSVCKVLKPKIESIVHQQYPKIQFVYIDIKSQPEIAAQNSVLTAPSIIGFVMNKETFRFSRNLSTDDLIEKIDRFYSYIFE